jgi:hypothetical protein
MHRRGGGEQQKAEHVLHDETDYATPGQARGRPTTIAHDAAYIGLSRLESLMSTETNAPKAIEEEGRKPSRPADDEPGTNAVEHEPDPQAEPLPDGQHKHVPRSPYTAGNS